MNRFPVVSAAIIGPSPLRWRFALLRQWLFDGGQDLAGPVDPVPRPAGDFARQDPKGFGKPLGSKIAAGLAAGRHSEEYSLLRCGTGSDAGLRLFPPGKTTPNLPTFPHPRR